MAEEFSLDRAIQAISERFTPEDRKEQEMRSRDAIGRINPNSPAMKARHLRALEASVLKQIDFLRTQPDSELKTIRLKNAVERYAELRSEQGDYAGAAALAIDPARIAVYRKILDAIDRPDAEECDCPTETAKDKKGNIVTINPRFNAKTIMTAKGPRRLMTCAKCGSMNAK